MRVPSWTGRRTADETKPDNADTFLEDAPETYDATDYYRSYPVVLVRLSRIDADALRDVLSVSWRLTAAKVRTRGRSRRPR